MSTSETLWSLIEITTSSKAATTSLRYVSITRRRSLQRSGDDAAYAGYALRFRDALRLTSGALFLAENRTVIFAD